MQPKKFLPAIFILTLAVIGVEHAVILNKSKLWVEPLVLVGHIFIVFLLYVFLQRRIGVRASLVGSILFAVFPSHSYILALGWLNAVTAVLYLLILAAAAYMAIQYERFYKFLKTQESLVRHLFLAGVYALLLAMALMSLQANEVWKDDHHLWSFRMAHQHRGETMRKWAKIQENDGAIDAAQKTYLRAIKEYPKEAESYFDLGALYIDLGKSEEVVKLFNQLLSSHPDEGDVYLRVMEIYGKGLAFDPENKIYKEKREEMLALYDQISKRKNYTANDYYNLGFLYEQVGGVDQAMRYYHKGLALDPKNAKILKRAAELFKAAGDFKNAELFYGRLVRFYPRTMGAYLELGIIYNASGDMARARAMYEKVIAMDPNNAQAYFNLGYLKESAGELKDAMADYEKAVEINPKLNEAYYNLGNVYASLGQNPEAIASYFKTITLNPKHQNAFVNLSILSYKARDFKGAIHYLDEAKNLGYSPPEGYVKALAPYAKK